MNIFTHFRNFFYFKKISINKTFNASVKLLLLLFFIKLYYETLWLNKMFYVILRVSNSRIQSTKFDCFTVFSFYMKSLRKYFNNLPSKTYLMFEDNIHFFKQIALFFVFR